MKRLAFLGAILVALLVLSACDPGGPPPCTTNCTTNYNYTLNITVNILLAASAKSGTPTAGPSSQQIKLSVIKPDNAQSAGFMAFNLPGVTYALDTNDPSYACYKSEKPQVGHAPRKYPGVYLVSFSQCGKQTQAQAKQNRPAANKLPFVIVFRFKNQPCLTLSSGATLCFPKP